MQRNLLWLLPLHPPWQPVYKVLRACWRALECAQKVRRLRISDHRLIWITVYYDTPRKSLLPPLVHHHHIPRCLFMPILAHPPIQHLFQLLNTPTLLVAALNTVKRFSMWDCGAAPWLHYSTASDTHIYWWVGWTWWAALSFPLSPPVRTIPTCAWAHSHHDPLNDVLRTKPKQHTYHPNITRVLPE
jgi:hypothetical protein